MTFAARPMGIRYDYVNPPGFVTAACSGSPAPQDASVKVYSVSFGGTQRSTINGAGNASSADAPWYIPQNGAPSAIWARLTVTAGTSPTSGDAVGSWVSIAGSSASWTWTRAVAGTTTATVTIELSTDSGGSTIVVTQTGIAISAEAN